MKIAVKITALAVAAVLTAISCAPEAELTERDWNAITANKDTSKLGIGSAGMEPDIYSSSLEAPFDTNSKKEVTIWFPQEADVLQASNASILGRLKAFMQIHAYAKATTSTGHDTLGHNYDYTFARREPASGGAYITVRLTDPTNHPTDNLVIKFDAGKYTFSGGKKLGGAGDTTPGIPYYDVYRQCNVDFTAMPSPPTPLDPFVPPYQSNWTLNISFPDPTVVSDLEVKATVASLSLGDMDTSYPTEANNLRNTVMNGWVNKFKLKRYGDRGWENATGTFKYEDHAIILEFTREEFIPYRVEAEGMSNLTIDYFGVAQKVKVVGNATNMDNGYNRNTVASNNYFWYDSTKTDRLLATGTAVGSLIDYARIETDAQNKNITLRLWFNPLSLPTAPATQVYLERISLAEFKKNVKIVYSRNGTLSSSNLRTVNDLCFVTIKDVEYTSSGAGPHFDEIKITLDSGYQYGSIGLLYLLLAPGFKYASPNIIFGNRANWEYEIDGVRYFDSYASFNDGGGGGPSAIPLTNGVWANGAITPSAQEVWYSFDVISGTIYYVWWNDSYEGDNTKTLDVAVSAMYNSMTGTAIFTTRDSGWNTPQQFTANTTGTVYVRVRPYTPGNTGTYGVAYNSRP